MESSSRAMMEYKGYLGKVDIDGEELYGTVVNLHRDHVDFRGRTIDDVRRAFHESVDFYLDGCRQDGEEPERPSPEDSSCGGPPTPTAARARWLASRKKA